jgi:hypothetical protein
MSGEKYDTDADYYRALDQILKLIWDIRSYYLSSTWDAQPYLEFELLQSYFLPCKAEQYIFKVKKGLTVGRGSI